MQRRRGVLVALVLAGFGAAALPACRFFRGPNEGPALDPTSPSIERAAAALPASGLGPSDVFEVRVFQEPDLSGLYRVAADGSIDYPLCGRLAVGGRNAEEVAHALTDCLKGRYLKNPQVTVFLRELNSRKVFVFGEVGKPGTFPFEEGMSVVQAVALAGGFTRLAAKNSCTITRVLDGREQRIKVPVEDVVAGRAPNFALLPGDILYVPESVF